MQRVAKLLSLVGVASKLEHVAAQTNIPVKGVVSQYEKFKFG
jgi:hypothetical protein